MAENQKPPGEHDPNEREEEQESAEQDSQNVEAGNEDLKQLDEKTIRKLEQLNILPTPDHIRKSAERILRRQERERNLHESCERVRNAQCFPIRLEDIERPGGIAETYSQARISPEVLTLLLNGDDAAFNTATRKGIFVFDFHEVPTNGPGKGDSVARQMEEGLSRTREQQNEHGNFCGWYLAEREGGPVMAWASSTLPPPDVPVEDREKTPYGAMLKESLTVGVTGGYLRYRGKYQDDNRILLSKVPYYWYFDTVQQNRDYPFAASKLFATITQQVAEDHPELSHILLYRLRGLHIESPDVTEQPTIETESLWGAHNLSSAQFFNDRGCADIAEDWNNQGMYSKVTIEGTTYHMLPAWEWMLGKMANIQSASQRIWEDIQKEWLE